MVLAVRASVSKAINSADFESVQTNHFQIGIHSFLLDAQHYGDNVENKTTSLLVPLKKALSGIPLSQQGRQIPATPKRARDNVLIAFS